MSAGMYTCMPTSDTCMHACAQHALRIVHTQTCARSDSVGSACSPSLSRSRACLFHSLKVRLNLRVGRPTVVHPCSGSSAAATCLGRASHLYKSMQSASRHVHSGVHEQAHTRRCCRDLLEEGGDDDVEHHDVGNEVEQDKVGFAPRAPARALASATAV